jgi:hypothetical protein
MDKGNVPKHFLDVMVRATPCSPMVFYGLLAWANLNAQDNKGPSPIQWSDGNEVPRGSGSL